jgi:hypothetical protein
MYVGITIIVALVGCSTLPDSIGECSTSYHTATEIAWCETRVLEKEDNDFAWCETRVLEKEDNDFGRAERVRRRESCRYPDKWQVLFGDHGLCRRVL